jgi:hypothetical protein
MSDSRPSARGRRVRWRRQTRGATSRRCPESVGPRPEETGPPRGVSRRRYCLLPHRTLVLAPLGLGVHLQIDAVFEDPFPVCVSQPLENAIYKVIPEHFRTPLGTRTHSPKPLAHCGLECRAATPGGYTTPAPHPGSYAVPRGQSEQAQRTNRSGGPSQDPPLSTGSCGPTGRPPPSRSRACLAESRRPW